MNCKNCNAPLEPDAKFCGECGQTVTPPSGEPVLNRKCSQCGADLDPSFQFCGECGQPVSQESFPEPSPVEISPMPPPPSPVAVPEPAPPTPSDEPPQPPSPVKPAPDPSAAPTVMVSPAQPPAPSVQQPPLTPPAPPLQQPPLTPPVAQPALIPPQAPTKKKRSGCVIGIIILAAIVICCGATSLLGWYLVDNAGINFSSSGVDLPNLDQLLDGNSELPPLEWILGDKIAITLTNATGLDVCMIGITPTYALDFSEDLLAEDGFLYAGETFTAYVDSWVYVNILVLDCFGNPLYEEYDFNIQNDDISITLSPP